MKRYALVLGKNPALSSAEIFTILRSRGIPFVLQDRASGFLIIDMEKPPEMSSLGGSIKLASVEWSGPAEELPQESVSLAAEYLPGKCIFGVSAYGTGWKDAAEAIKSEAAGKGRQCKFMNIPRERKALTHVEVIKKRLLEDGAEFLVLRGRQLHLARTLAVHNPFEFQKRDMKRPFKRPMLSIPPRLARMMVNLTGRESGDFLDAFCGIGTILQEASLSGFRAHGMDRDAQAVEWARRNMKWLHNEYGLVQQEWKQVIRQGDARRLDSLFPGKSVDAMASEPYLGQPLKRAPDTNKARKIIREVRPIYERFVRGASCVLKHGGRLVIVSPCFEARKGSPLVRLNMRGLAERNGFELVNPFKGTGLEHGLPLTDSEQYHRTIREISIMQKPAC